MIVLLIDDHPLFRAGMRLLLAQLDTGVVFHEAADVDEALTTAVPGPVDLLLLDPPSAPRTDLAGLLRRLQAAYSGAAVVVVGDDDRPSLVLEAITHGAAGVIPKTSTPGVLVSALRLVLAGGVYLPPNVLQGAARDAALADGAEPPAADTASTIWLSDRQREALMLAIQGRTNRAIAAELGISEGTVKQHLSAAYRTLGVNNRTEAVLVAAELNLWRLGDADGLAELRGAGRSASVHPMPAAAERAPRQG